VTRSSRALVVGLLFAAVACHGSAAQEPATIRIGAMPSSVAPEPAQPVGTRAPRAPSAPSAADAFRAFARAGLLVATPEPAAITEDYAASACSGAHASGQDLMVIVCEYPDEARAAAGLEAAKRREPGLGDRNLQRRGRLVVRIMDREVHERASTKEAWAALLATFSAL